MNCIGTCWIDTSVCLTNVSRRLKSDEEIGLEKEEEERAAPDKLASSNEDTDIEESDTISK